MIIVCWLEDPNFGVGEPSYAGYGVLILRVGVTTIPLLLDGSGSEFISFRVRLGGLHRKDGASLSKPSNHKSSTSKP